MRIGFTAGIIFLAVSIKIFGAIFVWRRIAGPIQHALLGMRAMLAGLPSQVPLSRVEKVEKMGLRIEPYPLSKDSIAFCWFILKYENVLVGMESRERRRCVNFFDKNYPGLLKHKVSRPWCCCPTWPGVETIGQDEDQASALFRSKDHLSKRETGRRSSARASIGGSIDFEVGEDEVLPGSSWGDGDLSPSFSSPCSPLRKDGETKQRVAETQIEQAPDTFLPPAASMESALSFRPKPTVLRTPQNKRDQRGAGRLCSLPDDLVLKSSLRKAHSSPHEAASSPPMHNLKWEPVRSSSQMVWEKKREKRT
eukprot:Cvel_17197.t1-p1 / transcript=Cvel_17197.t1 / gene=Cvel_17197 / organism=Chromera_velia_CCMP2878 / gene_product=hypothetical protein / transcript_product=hypothetical protein / location=Cvel_scaffold1359:20244-21757(+) / protein_length=308 / sequence_SO=supercontig / SO=protein_coding / is_pseudo=false